jgi:hypothetical protein
VRREPTNNYDNNAIRIDNVVREQIGHISRQVAAKLAPFMDSSSLLVEGALTGPKTYYDCPVGMVSVVRGTIRSHISKILEYCVRKTPRMQEMPSLVLMMNCRSSSGLATLWLEQLLYSR